MRDGFLLPSATQSVIHCHASPRRLIHKPPTHLAAVGPCSLLVMPNVPSLPWVKGFSFVLPALGLLWRARGKYPCKKEVQGSTAPRGLRGMDCAASLLSMLLQDHLLPHQSSDSIPLSVEKKLPWKGLGARIPAWLLLWFVSCPAWSGSCLMHKTLTWV